MEMTLSDGSVQTFEVIVQYVCVPTSAIRVSSYGCKKLSNVHEW